MFVRPFKVENNSFKSIEMTATGCLLLYTLGDDDELEITAKLEITVHPQRFKESYQFYAF